MTEPHIKIRHTGGNTVEGPPSLVLESHLAKGWSLESLTTLPPVTTDEQVSNVAYALFCEELQPGDQEVAERMWKNMVDCYGNHTGWHPEARAALRAAGFEVPQP